MKKILIVLLLFIVGCGTNPAGPVTSTKGLSLVYVVNGTEPGNIQYTDPTGNVILDTFSKTTWSMSYTCQKRSDGYYHYYLAAAPLKKTTNSTYTEVWIGGVLVASNRIFNVEQKQIITNIVQGKIAEQNTKE